MMSSAARDAVTGSASPTVRASQTAILFMLRNRAFAGLIGGLASQTPLTSYIIKFVYVLGMGRK